MYSVVLLAALTTGGQAPQWHHRTGCYGACYGSCYAGCYGAGSYWSGYGCWGSSRGCWGSPYGCYGSCAGGAWWGHYASCYGYDIGCVGTYPGYGSCHGCYGCYGCFGCYGGTVVPGPVETPPPMPGGEKGTGGMGEGGKGEGGSTASDHRARLIVSLPEGAKLFVDGREIQNVGTRKTFRTPTLEEGATYFYEVRAEVMRDGQPAAETRRVLVRSGEVSRADFSRLGAPATARK
jgi:uncharacterized protein (TIGR03000 family)